MFTDKIIRVVLTYISAYVKVCANHMCVCEGGRREEGGRGEERRERDSDELSDSDESEERESYLEHLSPIGEHRDSLSSLCSPLSPTRLCSLSVHKHNLWQNHGQHLSILSFCLLNYFFGQCHCGFWLFLVIRLWKTEIIGEVTMEL